jgi:hypothetical protein
MSAHQALMANMQIKKIHPLADGGTLIDYGASFDGQASAG